MRIHRSQPLQNLRNGPASDGSPAKLTWKLVPDPSGPELATTAPFGPSSCGRTAMYCTPEGLSLTTGALAQVNSIAVTTKPMVSAVKRMVEFSSGIHSKW